MKHILLVLALSMLLCTGCNAARQTGQMPRTVPPANTVMSAPGQPPAPDALKRDNINPAMSDKQKTLS